VIETSIFFIINKSYKNYLNIMGVIDDFKQEKNKIAIFVATEKMIMDKYNINIDKPELKGIIDQVILSICNDAILIKRVVKLIELNTIALTKIKDFIEINIINKKDIGDKDSKVEEIYNINKYNTDELLSKVIELEEKRKTVNTLASTEKKSNTQNTDTLTVSSVPPTSSLVKETPKYSLVNNVNVENLETIAYIIEKMESIMNNKKNINYKTLIINSYNRDWTIYNNRNNLSLSINIDLTKNIIEPKKLLMPKYVKNITPYLNMIINDGKKTQKFQFILGTDSNGNWDTWTIMNNDLETVNNIIQLNNKEWIISFTDFLNNELELGCDSININRITKTFVDNQYSILIDKTDTLLFNGHHLELINKYDNILLKTGDDNDIVLRVIEIDENNITVLYDNKTNESILNNINIKDITDISEAYLLNYKAQYSIILSYHSRIYK
jgi:hypothetical protein